MRIIITGALGHIGSYIIRDFANKFSNIQFVLLDSLMTQRFTSLYNLPNSAQYKFIETDIIDFSLKISMFNSCISFMYFIKNILSFIFG